MRAKLSAVQKREFRGAALSFQVTLQQPCSRDHHDGPQIRGQETTADFTASPGPDAVTVGHGAHSKNTRARGAPSCFQSSLESASAGCMEPAMYGFQVRPLR